MPGRSHILLRRALTAARLGFLFYGTSKTRFPENVSLLGKRRRLQVPNDGGYINDVINIWLDDEYGLSKLTPPPRTVVDVGANVGLFSLWAAHHFPEAVIHAYEPNIRVSHYIKDNLRGTGVKVFHQGVGASEGRAKMVDKRESRLASTTLSLEGDVSIASLSQVIERIGGSVDLVKFDCEGAEWDILLDRDSMKKISAVRMEYHLVSGTCIENFTRLVESIDFGIVELKPNQGFGIAWLKRNS